MKQPFIGFSDCDFSFLEIVVSAIPKASAAFLVELYKVFTPVSRFVTKTGIEQAAAPAAVALAKISGFSANRFLAAFLILSLAASV
jgi:hypothetical protein